MKNKTRNEPDLLEGLKKKAENVGGYRHRNWFAFQFCKQSENLGLTTSDLARELSINGADQYLIETGRKTPKNGFDYFSKLFQLGFDLNSLFLEPEKDIVDIDETLHILNLELSDLQNIVEEKRELHFDAGSFFLKEDVLAYLENSNSN